MSEQATETLDLKALKPWKKVNEGNNVTFSDYDISEAYTREMDGSPDLLYLVGKPNGLSHDCTRFGLNNEPRGKYVMLAQMIDGKIALSVDSIMQGMGMMVVDYDRLPQISNAIAEVMQDYLPHFDNIPTSNTHYPTEKKTLHDLVDAAADIKAGTFKGDIRQFHWTGSCC